MLMAEKLADNDNPIWNISPDSFGKLNSADTVDWPSSALEEWKYSRFGEAKRLAYSSTPAAEISNHLANQIVSKLLSDGKIAPKTESSFRFLVVNGQLIGDVEEFSRSSEISDFKHLTIAKSGREHVDDEFNGSQDPQTRLLTGALVKLNASRFNQLISIKISSGFKSDNPIELVHLSIPWINHVELDLDNKASEPCAVFSRIKVDLESGSEAALLERFITLTPLLDTDNDYQSSYLNCYLADFTVGENANFERIVIQNESSSSYSFAQSRFNLANDAVCKNHLLAIGSNVSRNEIYGRLSGKNSHLHLYGLSIANNTQQIDNSTTIDHVAPNAMSTQSYKGVYGQKSEGVFGGTIIVRSSAQKTNAYQSNRGLLLGESASFNTRPQLKIWADDVKCSHGASIGQLDEDALFYLMSRGISLEAARLILIEAFIGEVMAEVSNQTLKEDILASAYKKLSLL